MVTGGGQWVQVYLISYIPVMKNPTLVSAPFGSVIPTFWLIFVIVILYSLIAREVSP